MKVTHPISTDPDVLGGSPVFRGTRVPVTTLWDYVESGDTIDDFFNDFPSVTHDQVAAVLRIARRKVTADASVT